MRKQSQELLRLAGKRLRQGWPLGRGGKSVHNERGDCNEHFGATSMNAADDLSALGHYARNEMGDIRNARKTLLPAIDIYKMHLGAKHVKVRKNEVLLNRLNAGGSRRVTRSR